MAIWSITKLRTGLLSKVFMCFLLPLQVYLDSITIRMLKLQEAYYKEGLIDATRIIRATRIYRIRRSSCGWCMLIYRLITFGGMQTISASFFLSFFILCLHPILFYSKRLYIICNGHVNILFLKIFEIRRVYERDPSCWWNLDAENNLGRLESVLKYLGWVRFQPCSGCLSR